MEKDYNLNLDDNPDINLDIEPTFLEEQISVGQNSDQNQNFLFQYSNPITENNSGLLSISSQNESSEPSIEDTSLEIQNILYSVFSSIGGKRKMQDKVSFNYIENLFLQITIHKNKILNLTFYGIYDGFGDSALISNYLSEQLHEQLFKNQEFGLIQRINSTVSSLHKQINELFCQQNIKNCGSTALFAIQTDKEIIVANLGDSRAVLFEINNENSSFYQISTDHSATSNNSEIIRIESNGGFIFDMRGIKRVQGELAVTRAFTNNQNLLQFVAIEPDIAIIPLDKFKQQNKKLKLILASDGLWNELSNEEVLQFLNQQQEKNGLQINNNTSKELFHHALQKNNYIRDNISIICINLDQ